MSERERESVLPNLPLLLALNIPAAGVAGDVVAWFIAGTRRGDSKAGDEEVLLPFVGCGDNGALCVGLSMYARLIRKHQSSPWP